MSLEPIVIKSRDSFYKYLKEHGISREDFNQPVVIANGVTDCKELFAYFRSFNQPVVIPDSVTQDKGRRDNGRGGTGGFMEAC